MQATILRPRTLEQRLEDGATLLFECEERGDTGATYQVWLERWLELLAEYEAQAA